MRKVYGYTQDDLSHLAQIGRSTLGNIETAQNDITFSKLNKIAATVPTINAIKGGGTILEIRLGVKNTIASATAPRIILCKSTI